MQPNNNGSSEQSAMFGSTHLARAQRQNYDFQLSQR
jgi:hypothetical protein